MSHALQGIKTSFVHPGHPSEFYLKTNFCVNHWFDTSHQWTIVWFHSLLQSLVLTAAKWNVATHPFHILQSIQQRISHFALDFFTSQIWTIQSTIYHFHGLIWNPFWNIRWTFGWVYRSFNIIFKYMYDEFIYRWCPDATKMAWLHEQLGYEYRSEWVYVYSLFSSEYMYTARFLKQKTQR